MKLLFQLLQNWTIAEVQMYFCNISIFLYNFPQKYSSAHSGITSASPTAKSCSLRLSDKTFLCTVSSLKPCQIFLGTIRGLAYMITLVDTTLKKVKDSTILIHQFSLTADETWGIGIGLSFMLHEVFFWQSKIFSQLTFQKDMLHVPYHYKLLKTFGIT